MKCSKSGQNMHQICVKIRYQKCTPSNRKLLKSIEMQKLSCLKHGFKNTKYIQLLQLVKKKRKLLQRGNIEIIARTAPHK